MRGSGSDAHTFHSHFDNKFHRAIAIDISEGALVSCSGSRRMQDPRRAHLSAEKMHALDACIIPRILHYPRNVMHANTILHSPMGVVHACIFFQVQLRLGVLFPQEHMLGVLLPQGLMNIINLHVVYFLQGEEADGKGTTQSQLAHQFNLIPLYLRRWISGIN